MIAVLCVVIVTMQVYAKRAFQGRLKEGFGSIVQRASRVSSGRSSEDQPNVEHPEDAIGAQFSPAWSNSTETLRFRERTFQTAATSGERVSTLVGGGPRLPRARAGLPPAHYSQVSGIDDFSNKPINEEKLFE